MTVAEPVYGLAERRDIQGNTLPGFNKDNQHLIFLRLGDARAARRWLASLAADITTMDDVLAFRRRRKTLAAGQSLQATWMNIALSHDAIAALVGEADARAFGDRSFRQGLAARSTYLGDPTDPAHPGHALNWRVGGPATSADILIALAADDPGELTAAATAVIKRARSADLAVIFEQPGATLPGELRGHEHFGFRDGLSQPGVRGKAGNAFLTRRDARGLRSAKPGQPLLWPGQVLLGEPRQDPEHARAAAPPAANFPGWARRGSYLVFRRLNQDVGAFWAFVDREAARLDLTSEHFAALLVGRWPDGAPLTEVAPARGAGNRSADNDFGFADDPLGTTCPHFAHIRKANPRDSATDLGKPSDTLTRLILRRGIPFGPAISGVRSPPPALVTAERGLLFLAFMSTIEDQFEFLTRRWANSPFQPNVAGHDPVVGQSDRRGDRTRFIDVSTATGPVRVMLKSEWVTPTGGGYFFAPPISALTGALGAGS